MYRLFLSYPKSDIRIQFILLCHISRPPRMIRENKCLLLLLRLFKLHFIFQAALLKPDDAKKLKQRFVISLSFCFLISDVFYFIYVRGIYFEGDNFCMPVINWTDIWLDNLIINEYGNALLILVLLFPPGYHSSRRFHHARTP